MKSTIYLILWLALLNVAPIIAQVGPSLKPPKTIYSDRITDQQGMPLSNIQIRVKGSGTTTFTDVNGEFSINAKNGDIIVLSKNGKLINSYRLDGSIYYEVEDSSDRLSDEKSESRFSTSKYIREDNAARFNTLIDSANYFKKINPISSLDFIEKALNIADANQNKQQRALTYNVLGEVYLSLKQYDLAESNFSLAVENSPSTIYQLKLAKAHLLNKAYTNSEQQYMALLKKSGLSTTQRIEVYTGLGEVYFMQHSYTKALEQYETALNLSERLADKKISTGLYLKIATSLEAMGQTSKAEQYLLKSNINEDSSPQQAIRESKRAADFYSRNKNVAKEVEQRQVTLRQLENANVDGVIVEDDETTLTKPKAKLELGNALLKQNKPNEAIPLLEESASEAESALELETQKEAVQRLSEAYVSLGDDNQALANYKKYVSLVDQLYKKKENEIKDIVALNKELSDKQNRITSLEKDREISESKYQLYQTENKLTLGNEKRQQIIIYALGIVLILVLFSLFWMIKSNRQKKLANKLLALKSLRSQMNPHFIFNALNSVNSFIAKNDERTANRYLTDFSTLMRSVLINSEEDFISLEKELELLALYLKLEHSRFQDKFDFELEVDKQIDLEQFQIPPMLLQPYVENAVWHGLRYKQEKGFLNVKILSKDPNTVQISISDNGIGRKASAALKTEHQKKQRSKGMQNINQRIAILNEMYKDRVAVHIEDLNDDSTGTKVMLTLKKV